jgi:uncharacterized repeat protein (TIGR03803 family)
MGTRSLMILGRTWTAVARFTAWGVLVALAGCGGGGSSGGGGGGGGTQSYTLGGTISGLGSNSGLVLANGGTTLSVPAGATSFSFPSAIAAGTAYSVTVQSSPDGMSCAVASGGSGSISANVASVAVSCTAQSYTLGGTVTINGPSGVALSDQGLVLTNSSNGDTYTFSSNAASFTMSKSIAYGSAYALSATTQPTGLSCSVGNGTGTMPASNVTTIAVTCSAQTYTVGGTITGLGSATGLVLTNEGADATTVPAGASTFTMKTAVQYGAAYAIAVNATPTNVSCAVTSGSGTMAAANVTNVQVACGAGTESVLHSFGASTDGASPSYGSLIQASDGNLYGTTENGGAHSDGTVFEITPGGVETVLYSFGSSANDGANPYAGLIQASDGNLYGVTFDGGTNSVGTVFKITTAGVETVLYSFGSVANDGANPYGRLIQGSDGNLYGTTERGGSGYGTVFEITTGGAETVLHSFGSAGDGDFPYGGLIQGSDGNLYGTTELGGANSLGIVFKMTTAGTPYAIFHSFGAASDGSEPYGSLIQASDGNLYGTTAVGGANSLGTVFKLTTTGTETVLYSFGASGSDGTSPYGSVLQASDGNLYGLTQGGGTYSQGTVFQVTTAGVETVLHSFGSSAVDGAGPQDSLIQASNGALYGLTPLGGMSNLGVVFEIN